MNPKTVGPEYLKKSASIGGRNKGSVGGTTGRMCCRRKDVHNNTKLEYVSG